MHLSDARTLTPIQGDTTSDLSAGAVAKSRSRVALQIPLFAAGGCLRTKVKEVEMQRPAEMVIVRRAYELWEQAGKPDGRDQEFYHQAERELQNANEQAVTEQPRQGPSEASCS